MRQAIVLESWTTRKWVMNAPNSVASVNPSANSPKVMMLMATGSVRKRASSRRAGPDCCLEISSSNSTRNVVSSSNTLRPLSPRPRAFAGERFHCGHQLPRGQRRALCEKATNDARKRLVASTLFARQQLVGIYFDGNGLRRHTQTIHGPCTALQTHTSLATLFCCRYRSRNF